MKDFIECLKKHGYDVHDGGKGTYMIQKRVGIVYVPDYGEENSDLAFWCLDEIERLGWEFMFGSLSKNYRVSVWPDGTNDDGRLRIDGETKTEACTSALVAVLEAE